MESSTDTKVNDTPEIETREHPPLPASEKDLQWRQASRNPRFRLALIVGGIVVLVAGFFLWRYLGSYESTDDAQIDGHLNAISARVSGHVVKLLVNDNQYVEAGTPLVEIDPRDYEVAVARAKAAYQDALATAESTQVNVPITTVNTGSQLSAAQAEVESGRAGVAMARQQLEAARAQLEQAIANDIKAQNDVGRYKQLVDKQEISHQQYDQAVAAARSSAAGVAAARASVAAAEQQVAQAQQKRAELEQAMLNLQYTRLVAPVNGIVSNRTVEVGQNVQVGQELMKIINLDDIWVTANFKESQLRHMQPNQAVTISVDAYGKEYKGHVQSISGASGSLFSLLPPENATGNYVKVVQRLPVKITFDSGETREHILRPGMSVEAKVWIK